MYTLAIKPPIFHESLALPNKGEHHPDRVESVATKISTQL